jgi:signal peptidase
LRKVATYAGFGLIALVAITGIGIAAVSLFDGIRVITILSGSMRPDWARGELLFLAPEPARLVRVGQAIAYHPPSDVFNAVVVHQVIAVHSGASGIIAQTKGLANKAPDPWVDHLYGRVYHVVFKLPYLGMIRIWTSYWRLDVLFATIIAVAIAAWAAVHTSKDSDSQTTLDDKERHADVTA